MRRWIYTFICTAALFASACGSPGDGSGTESEASRVNTVGRELPADGAPLDEQYIRLSMLEPSTLDVGISLFDAQFNAFLFESLLVFDEDMEIRGAAAESWSVADDHVTWTFRIRQGAKWSDGRAVTAHDFEWSFRRLLDPAHANIFAYFYYPIKGARAFNSGQTGDASTVGVRALDDRTLVIETEEPCSYLPYILTFFTSVPAPRWQVEKIRDSVVRTGVLRFQFHLAARVVEQERRYDLHAESPLQRPVERISRTHRVHLHPAGLAGTAGLRER